MQIEVATGAAPRIEKMAKRDRARMEAGLTGVAAPGNYTSGAEQVVINGPPSRSPAVGSLTRWAIHRKILLGPLRRE